MLPDTLLGNQTAAQPSAIDTGLLKRRVGDRGCIAPADPPCLPSLSWSDPSLDGRADGVVLSDRAVTVNSGNICRNGFPAGQRPTFEGMSTAWGVEDLSSPERFALAMKVGVDQSGGVRVLGPPIQAVETDLISEDAINKAVTRVLVRSVSLGIVKRLRL